jgi:hypothetical protein
MIKGQGLLRICADDHMPDRATVYRWLDAQPAFRDSYVRARDALQDAGPGKARPARIRSAAMNCGPCAVYSGCKTRSRLRVHLGARRAVHDGRLCPDGGACRRSGRDSGSRLTRTCCAIPVALRWRTRATIRGRCRPTSDTRTSSTRFAIRAVAGSVQGLLAVAPTLVVPSALHPTLLQKHQKVLASAPSTRVLVFGRRNHGSFHAMR